MNDYSAWEGEEVLIEQKGVTHRSRGIVKVSKNGALILTKNKGKRAPEFIEHIDILSVRAVPLKKAKMAAPNRSTIRDHLFVHHGVNAPYSSPEALIRLHERMHRENDNDEDGRYGHVHI